jgi:hypothetical protein
LGLGLGLRLGLEPWCVASSGDEASDLAITR